MPQDLLHRGGGSLVSRDEDAGNTQHHVQGGLHSYAKHITPVVSLCPQAVPGGRTEPPLRTQTWEPDCQIPGSNPSSVTYCLCNFGYVTSPLCV